MVKIQLDGIVSGKIGELSVITATANNAIISDGSSSIQLNAGDTFTAVSQHRVYRDCEFESAGLDGIINTTEGGMRINRLVCIYK